MGDAVAVGDAVAEGYCIRVSAQDLRRVTTHKQPVSFSSLGSAGRVPGAHTAASLARAAARRVASVATLRNATMSARDLRRSFTTSLRCYRRGWP